jgi:hypothetical protein
MFSEGHCSFFDVAELEDYTEPIQESPLHVGTGPVLFDRSHNHKLICSQQTHGIRINYSSAGHYDLQGDQKKITSEISGTFRSTKHLLHCFSSIKIVTMRQLRHTQNTNLVRSQRLSNARRGRHLDGWPSENLLFFKFFKLFMFDSFPKSCPQFF